MIAMTHDAFWKRSRFKGLFVRAFFVHLGLESVTVRTHILNLVDSWRRRAMVSMTRCTGRRTQIASHRERFVVHARAVLCELIRGNGISLHVTRVRMAASARVRHVDRIDRGAGIAGGPQIVDTMTIRAHCNLRVSGREALAVHTGAVLAQLVGAQAGVELPNIRRIRMATFRTTAGSACDRSCPSTQPFGSWLYLDRRWLGRLRGSWRKSDPFVRVCPG